MSTLSKIRELLSPAQRRSAMMLFGFMLVGMALETIGIGLVIPVVALLTQPDLANHPLGRVLIESMGSPSRSSLIVVAMLALMVIYLLKNLFLTFLAWWQTRFAFNIEVELSQRLFTIYLRQPYTFHLQRNSSELFHNIGSEVGLFTSTVNHAILLVTEGLVLLGIGLLLLWVQPVGAVIVVLVLGGAAFLFHQATRRQISRWGELRYYHSERSVQHLIQGLGGAKDVKLLGRETDFINQYRIHNTQSARVGQLMATLQSMPRLWLELLMVVGLATLVLTMLVQGVDVTMIVPTLGLFAAAAFRLTPSVNRILIAVQSLRYELVVLDTLRAELALAAPEPIARTDAETARFRDCISMTGVSYTYANATVPALNNVTIRIGYGECVGLIGSSGSGKSTLVDVLLGLLAPQSGQVVVDGRDIQPDLRSWQDQIGYVPQSIYLTDDTLRRNVAFGLADDEIDEDAVRRALDAAQLTEFVTSLPNATQTFVGERGIRLSGGQRQRIGIARALYHDPAVLVLDEATSSLDLATEQSVMRAVNELQGTKTIVIVAHRLSTVENCARLYRLEAGKIVAEGTPHELLRRYAGLGSLNSTPVSQ
jgi:ATP-binding cassette, subfamily B, bacterial PglK